MKTEFKYYEICIVSNTKITNLQKDELNNLEPDIGALLFPVIHVIVSSSCYYYSNIFYWVESSIPILEIIYLFSF